MSIQLTGPFSNFKTSYNTPNTVAANQQQAKTDVLNVANKPDNKNVKIIGVIAALAAVGAGIVYALSKHKMPDDLKTAFTDCRATNDIVNSFALGAKKQSDEVMQEANKLFDELTVLFKKGDEALEDGSVLRRITDDGSQKVMEEFAQDGSLIRKSFFSDGILEDIEIGYREFSDGSDKQSKCFQFINGKLSSYSEGIERHADGKWQMAKNINFDDGKQIFYAEGYSGYSEKFTRVSKGVFLENGEQSWYVQGLEKCSDGSTLLEKGVFYDASKPFLYSAGYKKFADGTISQTEQICLKGGKPTFYIKGAEIKPNNDSICKKLCTKSGFSGWKTELNTKLKDFFSFLNFTV